MQEERSDSPLSKNKRPNVNPITLDYQRRTVRMHSLSEDELDALAEAGGSLNVSLFGLCMGAVITIIVTLTTTPITAPVTRASYVGALIASSVLALYFGVRSWSDRLSAKAKLQTLKGNHDQEY